mmetsp:Transcript_65557/g.77625  ORF Transcript_65557/g.77625 Transcript_65557/m.77625 type:complete len:85 (+) Transcript_65557:156-410(+)
MKSLSIHDPATTYHPFQSHEVSSHNFLPDPLNRLVPSRNQPVNTARCKLVSRRIGSLAPSSLDDLPVPINARCRLVSLRTSRRS